MDRIHNSPSSESPPPTAPQGACAAHPQHHEYKPTVRRCLTLFSAIAAVLAGVAFSQGSHRDLAIDHIRRVVGIFSGFSGAGYGDLDLDRDLVDLQRLMSSREFNAAGLDKLSPGEMQSLNRWVSELAFDLLRPGERGCSPAIESKIDGEFEGWSGDTIVKLMNGQIWQQSSYTYSYAYKYSPDVTVFSSSGGCKMLVEGMDGFVSVRQLR